ncbi:tetratricopeptide repeat protein [Diaphorobacter caeni]|uniref:tetratricopeptide repeat protein n=1 Tax=Diaphorobacter caeni TaxID=2784387 RepID=UPI0018902875|nr:tetratricopeptide repeat protein [Diaphorobacter caeni]MBF5003221.1 tetratricopeptide repeat protein [Diaphorobacter caeni]
MKKTSAYARRKNASLGDHSRTYLELMRLLDYPGAYRHMLKVHAQVPGRAPVLMDLAYSALRCGLHEEALRHYRKAIEASGASVNTNIYDGLAEVCHYLKNEEELRKYAGLALQSKRDQVAGEPRVASIEGAPPAFDPGKRSENVIAYSLFGGLPRYCETSLINVDLAKDIYPEWTCRFYVDDTVPAAVVQKLKGKGADVVQVSARQKELSGLYWRFFVMDDPTVKRFLIRDADSLVSHRERAAVDEWLASGQWFHTMRDRYSHTELILAGMWGGAQGVFKNVEQLIRDFVKTGRFMNARVMDQHFLRFVVWPLLSQSVCAHDSQGFEPGARVFPTPAKQAEFEHGADFHVGMNEGSAVFSIAIGDASAGHARWELLDEHGAVVCAYETAVPASREIRVDVPRLYGRRVQAGEWRVNVHSCRAAGGAAGAA